MLCAGAIVLASLPSYDACSCAVRLRWRAGGHGEGRPPRCVQRGVQTERSGSAATPQCLILGERLGEREGEAKE
eukprot:366301-Chlamydomonas_euryale.AAC.60